MTGFVISAVSMLAGIIATVLISRYYFGRSVKKAITPYVLHLSDVLGDIAPDVRSALNVEFHGVTVSDLTDLRILVANTGERAIRDVIQPLALRLPSGAVLLDAGILHVEPSGRSVAIDVPPKHNNGAAAEFIFPLLNRGEFFIARALVQGSVELDQLEFTIAADDLPPRLLPQRLPFEYRAGPANRQFETGMFATGLGLLLLALGAGYLVFLVGRIMRSSAHVSIWSIIFDSPIPSLALLATAVMSLLAGVVGVLLSVMSVGQFSVPRRKPPFVIPEQFTLHPRFYSYGYRGAERHREDEKAGA